jgi:transposase
MFFPEGQVRVFVFGEPVSMRLGYDGLYALTKNRLGRDPLDGNLYAFINRRATQIKVLYFDRMGLCLWSMRLEQGRLLSDWRAVRTREMDWTGLKLLLEGIEPKRVRKRYRHANLSACGAQHIAI